MYFRFSALLVVVLSLASCKCIREGCRSGDKGTAYDECVQRRAEKGMLVDKNDRILVLDREFFAFNEYMLTESSKKTLRDQAAWLKDNESINIVLTGHCDERGTREYNIGLGERRANAAKDYLVSLGIDASRIQVVSKGKDEPIVLGSTPEAWAQNRVAITSKN